MKINENYPKCKNCMNHDCFAGEVNHSMETGRRGECLKWCGCQFFVKADSECAEKFRERLEGER